MKHIRVYDPAQCCSTGVCGPDADARLAQFSSALEKARKAGSVVDRFTLGHQPGEYVKNTTVKSLRETDGIDVLPIVFVGDDIVSKGDYPTRDDLLSKVGVEDDGQAAEATACCAPAEDAKSSSCC